MLTRLPQIPSDSKVPMADPFGIGAGVVWRYQPDNPDHEGGRQSWAGLERCTGQCEKLYG